MPPIDWDKVPDTEPRPLQELKRDGWRLWLWDADDTLDLDADLDPLWRGPDGKGTWYVATLIDPTGSVHCQVEGPDPDEVWSDALSHLGHPGGEGRD